MGEACTAIFWPASGFTKEKICQLWVLNRGDLNFCVRSTPLQFGSSNNLHADHQAHHAKCKQVLTLITERPLPRGPLEALHDAVLDATQKVLVHLSHTHHHHLQLPHLFALSEVLKGPKTLKTQLEAVAEKLATQHPPPLPQPPFTSHGNALLPNFCLGWSCHYQGLLTSNSSESFN